MTKSGHRSSVSLSCLAFVILASATASFADNARADEWRAASGNSYMPDGHDRFSYKLPAGKTPNDIVAMAIAGSDDHVYAWYKDGTVSSGTSTNLEAYRKPYRYEIRDGETPGNIVGIAIAKSDDRVYAWYDDGTVSSGTTSNLSSARHRYDYTLPPGKSPDDIVDMDIAPDDHVFVWYKDGTASSGTTDRLDKYRALYKVTLSAFEPPDGWYRQHTVGMGIAGSTSRVYIWFNAEK